MEPQSDKQQRRLTDEDVQALADELEKRMVNRLYLNIGKGLWSIAWKGFILFLLWLAAKGAWKTI